MKRIGRMLPRTALICLLLIAGTGVAQADEGTLHLIIACDRDDPDLGEGFEINEGLVRSNFIDAVATRSLRFYAPWGIGSDGSTKLTGRNLLDEIEKIDVKPNDTLMVYLACHGFWDKTEEEQWFRFASDTDAGDDSGLLRKTLIKRIKSRGVRLGMLVTDACTNYEKLPTDRSAGPYMFDPLETTAPLYQALFFEQEGFLDLSSSSPGQFTLYYNNYKDIKAGVRPLMQLGQKERRIPGSSDTLIAYTRFLKGSGRMRGGLFTESMASLLEKHRDENYDWTQFTDLLRDDVEERFGEENPDGQLKTGAGTIFQDAQTVSVNEFPGMPTDPEPASFEASEKFGVSGIANDDGGFLILTVDDDSQASRHGLSVGEVIEKINNRPVNTPEELEEALAKAPATFRITVGGSSFVVRP